MKSTSLLTKLNWLLAGCILLLLITLASGSLLLGSCDAALPAGSVPIDLSNEEMIKRGSYLVNTSGCHDCHSPKVMTPLGPEPDPKRLLSGHPSEMALPPINKEASTGWVLFNQHQTSAVGPWGISFAANITSDETGVGNWSEEQFFVAIRKGRYKGLERSRPLLPPMPWQVYRNMTDDDIKAIFAYLKSTAPVKNIVPAPVPPDQIR